MKKLFTIVLGVAALSVLQGCKTDNKETTTPAGPVAVASPVEGNYDVYASVFEDIAASEIANFKGGTGSVSVQAFPDDIEKRLMFCTMPAGGSVGYHVHDASMEIIHVVKGTATILYDSTEYTYTAGQVHYCPKGHGHSITNATDSDLVVFNVIAAQ